MGDHEERWVEIDGSYGEGGGQILRTALAFSAISRIPVTVNPNVEIPQSGYCC